MLAVHRLRDGVSKKVREKLSGPEGEEWKGALSKETGNFESMEVLDEGGYTEADVRRLGGRLLSMIVLLDRKRSGKAKARKLWWTGVGWRRQLRIRRVRRRAWGR